MLLLLCFCLGANWTQAQDKLYEKGNLFLGVDLGVALQRVKTRAIGYLNQQFSILPIGGLAADYKFVHNPFGLNSGLYFNLYRFEDLSFQYISIPFQGNLRFGEKVQIKLSAGLNKQFLVSNQVQASSEYYEVYNETKKKYSIGFIGGAELSYF